ncbi:unnamed protein product [Orchesella dallaii]|uniref:ubiquitinyl hydrolase 1 n=1 Tax=Orchesella dallaii TaxID=48710 RepID=A0ABP1RKI8_9HEXA
MFKSIISSISGYLGTKESKAVCITYEDARSRITDAEYRRLYEAFKRVVTQNSHMSKQAFAREVLGDLFPPEIAGDIYLACGGTSKGIQFKDLVTALVLLTKGTQEEKIRFIFSFYCNDQNVIIKDEFILFIQKVEGCNVPDSLYRLFMHNTITEYDAFRKWLLENPNVTSVSCWLIGKDNQRTNNAGYGYSHFTLSDDHETPTFYQTLAGVTHLEEEDIIELEKRYWQLHSSSRSGKMDIATLLPLVSPPLPDSIFQGFFDAFDENRDGHIDFKEMACGISAAARGPPIERQKFCFKIFDLDKDGLLSLEEVEQMIGVLKSVLRETMSDNAKDDILAAVLKDDFIYMNEIKNTIVSQSGMTLEEYLVWSLSNPLPEQFLTLIYQVCQIVFGLKPLDPAEEFDVVMSWLSREEKRGFQTGQIWYVISMDWWNAWVQYANPNPAVMSNSDSGLSSISGSIGGGYSNGTMPCDNVGANDNRVRGTSARTCWSLRKSTVENAVASDNSQNVVVTSINTIDHEETDSADRPSSVALNHHSKTSSSSLSLATLDSSSSTPSPVNSPGSVRRGLTGSINGSSASSYTNGGRKRRPGAIDSFHLLINPPSTLNKIPSLTGEGGRLRTDIVEGRDFKILPQTLWNALQQWYGAGVALPRQVIETEKKLELELFPLTIMLYRHQLPTNAMQKSIPPASGTPWAGMAGMYGATALSTTISFVQNSGLNPPKRILTFTASFSRKTRILQVWNFICQKLRHIHQDTRLDLLHPDDQTFLFVLEEEEQTLEEAGISDNSHILIETRNKDQTWPEEIATVVSSSSGAINSDQQRVRRAMSVSKSEKGVTGLNNLGNTCFMNAALQCVSNTKPLTLYFMKKMYMHEINRTNPLGMKGHIAKQYGDLVIQMWKGQCKTIAPFNLRLTIGKYSPRFSGFQQNDSQELLAFLLDGLHEDLNRVAEKPYVELKDSNNRPDIVCAQEAWENHLLRNKSIIVDLFHGQLKSAVRCRACNTESVRFDPFNYLTLPLPMESYLLCDFVVVRQDGKTPTHYGILAGTEDRVSEAKQKLCDLVNLRHPKMWKLVPDNLLLAESRQFRITNVFQDGQRVKGCFVSKPVYAYEVCNPLIDETGRSAGPEQDEQIKRILTSTKNQNPQPSGATLRPSSADSAGPSHSRQSSYSSSGSGNGSTMQLINEGGHLKDRFLIAVHRKVMRQESYFLAAQKSHPILFGTPIVIPVTDGMTHLDLYKRVWAMVARLLSPLPPVEGPNIYNHAQDCDDSLGYEYPFVLRIICREAEWKCGLCFWWNFCRGCTIMCSENQILEKLNCATICIAIDWDPTALHLRYQTTQELETVEDTSVPENSRKLSESVPLATCLDSFTKEEELSEDEKYLCSRCGSHQLATKKLQIWRLPPVLIVHLKRFQPVQGRWIKSHKVVNFPFKDFYPNNYLAEVPRRTSEAAENPADGPIIDQDLFPLQDFHQHRLMEGQNPFDLKYKLYAIVCHSGIMGGGHYISYAKGSNDKWYCFNDSSCKEVQEDQIETSTAYMLFYEREGLDYEAYLPRIDPKAVPVVTDDEMEAEENDLKKLCCMT